MAKYKSLSHIERLNDKVHSSYIPSIRTSHTIYERCQEKDEATGVVVYKLQRKVIEPRTLRLSHLSVADFSIENLRVTGAIDTLKYNSITRDNLSQSANLMKTAKSIVDNE